MQTPDRSYTVKTYIGAFREYSTALGCCPGWTPYSSNALSAGLTFHIKLTILYGSKTGCQDFTTLMQIQNIKPHLQHYIEA
jgi:hypothetical protein